MTPTQPRQTAGSLSRGRFGHQGKSPLSVNHGKARQRLPGFVIAARTINPASSADVFQSHRKAVVGGLRHVDLSIRGDIAPCSRSTT